MGVVEHFVQNPGRPFVREFLRLAPDQGPEGGGTAVGQVVFAVTGDFRRAAQEMGQERGVAALVAGDEEEPAQGGQAAERSGQGGCVQSRMPSFIS